MGFLEREHKRTENKLGVLDDMEKIEVVNYGSGAEERECHEMRPVGISEPSGQTTVADDMARTVIEEEDHPGMGHSAMDLFFQGLEEAILSAIHRKTK